jgi:hypothetical protein
MVSKQARQLPNRPNSCETGMMVLQLVKIITNGFKTGLKPLLKRN